MKPITAKWTNSEESYNLVVSQIKERWSEDETKAHNPRLSCYTYAKWKKHGYSVKRNERAIKTNSVVDIADESEQVIGTLSIPVNLFHRLQVVRTKRRGM